MQIGVDNPSWGYSTFSIATRALPGFGESKVMGWGIP
jgi:hypothetical protein